MTAAQRLATCSWRNTTGFSDIGKEVISQISDATGKRRRLEIRYKAASTGKETIRRVDPYQIWAMNGVFYSIGLCHLRDAVHPPTLIRRDGKSRVNRDGAPTMELVKYLRTWHKEKTITNDSSRKCGMGP